MLPPELFLLIPSPISFPESETYGLEYYVGREAIHMKGVLKLVWPLRHGIISDWKAWEKIIHHIFYRELRVNPQEQPVLLTEAPLTPKENRERMAEDHRIPVPPVHPVFINKFPNRGSPRIIT